MAAEATQMSLNFGYVGRIHYVSYRMIGDWMTQSILQPQNHDSVLLEVVLGQLDLAVEDGDQMLGFQLLRCRVRTVALQAETISFYPQQMIVVAAVRGVASGAALTECRLVMHGFLPEIGDVGVAAEADVHRICLWKSRLAASMRAVAIGAIAGCSRMLHFRLLDQLSLVGVAGHAKVLDVSLGQNNFSVLGWRMASVTLLVSKRRMHELGHQLGSGGLVRIVTLQTVGGTKRLILVRLLQGGIFWVVAVEAEGGRGFGQMKIEFGLAHFAGLMRRVARVAAHVERGVTAAVLSRILGSGVMAGKAEIVFLVARGRLQQLKFVVRRVRVVAFQAIANCGRVDRALDLGGVLIVVATQADFVGNGTRQRNVSDIAVGANLMAAQTAHGDGGMDELAFGLILVAFEALGSVDVLI